MAASFAAELSNSAPIFNPMSLMIPRGFARVGVRPDGKPGLTWNAKYASLGANGVGLPYIFDGLNEKGLLGRPFLFPDYRWLHALYRRRRR